MWAAEGEGAGRYRSGCGSHAHSWAAIGRLPSPRQTHLLLRLDSDVLKRMMARGAEEVAELQRREAALGVEVDAAAAAYMRVTAVTGRRHSVQTEVVHRDPDPMASVRGSEFACQHYVMVA